MNINIKGLVSSTKTRIVLITITVLLALYSLLGFLIIPAVLSNQIPKLCKENINRDITVKDIKFNPFSMEVEIRKLDLKNKNEGSTFVSFEKFYLNIAVIKSISELALVIDEVNLQKPYSSIQRDKQEQFNFSDLQSDEKVDEEKSDEIFPVIISKIIITDGKLNWEDDFYSQKQQEQFYPIHLNIDNFTTIADKHSQLGFAIKLASGGSINWKGQLKLTPLYSKGLITVEEIKFNKLWSLFLQDSVNFEIQDGSELITIDYVLNETPDGIQVKVDNAFLDIYNLKLSEKNNAQSLITIPYFNVSGIAMDLQKQTVNIAEVSAKDSQFISWLNKQGEINFQSLFALVETEQAPTAKTNNTSAVSQKTEEQNSQSWKVKLNKLAFNNFSLNFTDKTLSQPAAINVSSLNLNAIDLSNDPAASLPFDIDLKLNRSGQLKIAGNAKLQPFDSQLKVNLANIAIKDFQPYLDQFLKLDVISGLLNVDVNVSLKQPVNQAMAIKINGNSHIDQFVTRDKKYNKDFLNWEKLSLDKIDIDLAKNSYIIETVKILKPYARVQIRKNKSINVNDVVVSQSEKPVKNTENKADSESKQTTRNSPPPSYKISHFTLTEGVSDFSDRSLILPFSAHMNRLKGSVKGISSAKNSVIKANLNGKVDNLAPVVIKGRMTPDTGNSNFSLSFKNMPLPLMTPYMAEFAGRKIEKGNMSLDLKYKIHNKSLAASNNLFIDQLVLGDEVKNPDAVSLPLGLAIALLQDNDGKISLDVPVTGDLDNPDFSVGGIIVDALVNVITKIVAAPFNAIASLIDTDEDISKVNFAAGNDVLETDQIKKLDGLVTALIERPALNLEIKGSAYSDHDWPYLQAEALDNQILAIRSEELLKNGEKNDLPKQLLQSDEEYQRILADVFIAKFPEIGERSLFGTPQLIDPALGDFQTVARTKLAALIKPDKERLHKLAVSRAQAIAKHLMTNKIAMERIFLLDVDIDPDTEDSEKAIASTLILMVN